MRIEDEEVVLYVQLVDARTARVLWAERMNRKQPGANGLEGALALAISTQLAVQLQPGEQARLAQVHSADAEAWLFYRQGLITIMPPRDLARVRKARELFDRARAVSPGFAGSYAGYSFSHSTRALFMNSDDPELELERAMELATSAITMDPEFGAGHAMLALAQVLAGDSGQALLSARKALSIQPGDAFSRFVIGMSLVLDKRPAAAIPHLQEALRLDPVEPRMPYINLLGIARYASGDFSGALADLENNADRGGPQGPHIDVFAAASLAQLGESGQARELIQGFRTSYPEFPALAWLQRWLQDPEQLEQTVALLESQGMVWL
jgi:adenylate cyclase